MPFVRVEAGLLVSVRGVGEGDVRGGGELGARGVLVAGRAQAEEN